MKNPVAFGSSHYATCTNSGHRRGITNPLLLRLLLVACATLCSTIMAQQSSTISNRGKSFIFAFPSSPGLYPVVVSVVAVSIPTQVVFEYPKGVNTTLTALPDKFIYFAGWDYWFSPSAVENSISNTSALQIHADHDVAVYLTSGASSYYSEKSMALPVASLNSKYVVLDEIVSAPTYAAEFSVTAVVDNTIVRITPSTPLTDHAIVGQTFQLTLNAGQTYYGTSAFESQGATGTIIEASKKVAVTNGYNGARDSFEMAQPVQNWGTSYVSAPLPFTSWYRIVVSEPNTVIKLNGKIHATLSPLNYKEVYVDGPVWFTSTKPFFVAQFGRYTSEMVNLVPVDQYLTKNTIAINGYYDYVSLIYIIASQSDVGKLTLNGFEVAADMYQNINGTNLAMASLSVGYGTYTTSSTHGHSLTVCENNKLNYGCFTGGFKKTNPIPPTKKPTRRPTRKPTGRPTKKPTTKRTLRQNLQHISI